MEKNTLHKSIWVFSPHFLSFTGKNLTLKTVGSKDKLFQIDRVDSFREWDFINFTQGQATYGIMTPEKGKYGNNDRGMEGGGTTVVSNKIPVHKLFEEENGWLINCK